MTIHREGYKIILVTLTSLTLLNTFLFYLDWNYSIQMGLLVFSILFFLFIVSFFRSPKRDIIENESAVYAPADGKIVAIEEVFDDEYFHDKRIQVSIFMSPFNVHVNWYPISGIVNYFKYHPGKFLVAWHPKSSKLNERTTVVIKKENSTEVLFRQIAGAVARRIVCYSKKHDNVELGQQCGFIKFGSRVDILLPLNAQIKTELAQIVKGCHSIIAEI